MEPGLVVGLGAFEGVGPAATVLVLRILPFRTDACFEEMVVGLLSEFGGRGDVVLKSCQWPVIGLLSGGRCRLNARHT